MATLAETMRDMYVDPMGGTTGAPAAPIAYPASGSSIDPGPDVHGADINGYWKALARYPVKAAMAIPDVAQKFAQWKYDLPEAAPYSRQAEDALMSYGVLPQRDETNSWDQRADTLSGMLPGNPAGAGAKIAAGGLGKLLGAAAASKAILLPLLGARGTPAVQAAEDLISQGRVGEAYKTSQDLKNGVLGVSPRFDGNNAIEFSDRSATLKTRELERIGRQVAHDKSIPPGTILDDPLLYGQYHNTLGEIMTHDPAFSHLPELRDIPVVPMKPNPGSNVHGSFNGSRIAMNMGLTPQEMRDTLFHETQHFGQRVGANLEGWRGFGSNAQYHYLPNGDYDALVQSLYGLNQGYNPGAQGLGAVMWRLRDQNAGHQAMKAYWNNLGEAEARMTGAGANVPTKDFWQWAEATPTQRMTNPVFGVHTVQPEMVHTARGWHEVARLVDDAEHGSPQDFTKFLVKAPNE